MPLKNILVDVASKIGINLNSTNPKDVDKVTWLKNQINLAAKDLYESDDLVGCLREQVFDIDLTDGLITLPWYVDKIRGIRRVSSKFAIKQHDHRIRYSTTGWTELNNCLYTWRVKEKRAIGRSITNAAPLEISIPFAESTEFSVNITGSTNTSVRLSEKVTFSPGDLVKVTTNTFNNPFNEFPIESIIKSDLTTYDITVKDTKGEILAIVPNSEFNSRYTIVQILDFNQSAGNIDYCCEVLFKYKFQPFRNDFDEFPALGYDDAIYWVTLHRYEGMKGNTDLAAQYWAKALEICNNVNKDTNQAQEQKVDFGTNRFLQAQKSCWGPSDVRYNYWGPFYNE